MFTLDEKAVFWKKVGEETVLLNMKTGFYYTLNGMGSQIWEMIVNKQDEMQIISEISVQYNVSEDCVKKDFIDLLKVLKKEKLLFTK